MTEEVFIMSQERVKRPGHTRWYISSLLSGIIILNYFDRVAISVAAPAIQDSFHLTATELGIVFSIYTYSYTLMQLPVGSLLDRFGVAWVTRVGMTIWSFLTILLAFLQGKLLLYLFRFLIGLTSASAFPAASKATALWFPPSERGLANSLFDSAAKFSNVIGAPLVAFLVTTFDWRVAFLTIGCINVLFTIFFWQYYEQPERHKRISKSELNYIQKHNAITTEQIPYKTGPLLKKLACFRQENKKKQKDDPPSVSLHHSDTTFRCMCCVISWCRCSVSFGLEACLPALGRKCRRLRRILFEIVRHGQVSQTEWPAAGSSAGLIQHLRRNKPNRH